jgi:hypothetical protein
MYVLNPMEKGDHDVRRKLFYLAVLGFVLIFRGTGVASNTATQTVTVQVSAINEISVSGNPGNLTVSTAMAGSQPSQVTDATTTYAVTTNQTSAKITGQITAGGAMPGNTTLYINLTAPTGGTSAGDVSLSNGSASDLVTVITKLAESGKTITYKFSATAAAGVVTSTQRTITLTLTGGT